jgi:hypothetical protein
VYQSVKVRLDLGKKRNVKTERVRQECYLSLIQLTVYSKWCTKEAFEGFGDFKTGGHVICTVKYADDLVLLCEEGTAQLGMTDRLLQVGRHYGMETNVEKTMVVRIKNKPTQYTL